MCIFKNINSTGVYIYKTKNAKCVSPYWPEPWTKFCPRFASKMGIYVSCALSLTTAFSLTYVCTIYCENSVRAKWREFGEGGHACISHYDISLDLLVVPEKQQQGRWVERSIKQRRLVGETQLCWLPL